MSQIFLLTGENLYEIATEKKRWSRGFAEKHGEENLLRLDAKSVKFPILVDEVSAAPFIAEKRLIVLSGIPKLEKGQIELLLNAIHPDALLLIVEPKPDKRLTTTKEVLAAAEVSTFPLLRGDRLIAWLIEQAKIFGSDLPRDSALHLISTVGEDQMLLISELEKLSTHALGQQITKEHIDMLCMLCEEQVAWRLMDLIAVGKTDAAIAFAAQLIKNGESPYGLWSQMLWIVSQIGIVSAAVQAGNTNPAQIAKAGVPFPTAKTLIPFAQKISEQDLLRIIEKIVDTDIALKTGGHKVTAEAPDEMHAIIDTCLASLRAS
ncbi:MAG: DNA polymerase III subunit delta [Candidatus Peribacteraceae bacterium]|jgi:DNA polymerase-3 subunit delta|nr:DNA polymerase III subunit delta [Candidatus Peribacteraceae bacterium]